MKISAVPVEPTREFFIPVTEGTEVFSRGCFPCIRLDAGGESARICFYVPHDFNIVVEAALVVIGGANNAVADIDIWSEYGAEGEFFQTHAENDLVTTYNMSFNKILEIDLLGILSALVAQDYVGIKVGIGGAADALYVLGVRFRYE